MRVRKDVIIVAVVRGKNKLVWKAVKMCDNAFTLRF